MTPPTTTANSSNKTNQKNNKRAKSYFVIFNFGNSALITYTSKELWDFTNVNRKKNRNWFVDIEHEPKKNYSILRMFGIELSVFYD